MASVSSSASNVSSLLFKVLFSQCNVVYTFIICLGHPWVRDHPDVIIPMDMLVFRLMKAYICSSSLRKSALGVRNRLSDLFQFVFISIINFHPFSSDAKFL